MEAQQLGDHHYDRMKELKEFDESKAGVKGLSDSGITSIPRIFVHRPEKSSDAVKKPDDSQPSISIPVIDLSGINSPSDRPELVDQVRQAVKEWGFFQVINHGIPHSVLNDTVSAVEAFNVGDFLEVILLTAPPYASQINIYYILTSMRFD